MSRRRRDFAPAAPRFRPPRRARRRGERALCRAPEQLPARRARRCRRVFQRLADGIGHRDRRARLAGHRRRRPCARTRLPLLRRNRGADRGRPGIAEDLAQYQRAGARARRRSAGALSVSLASCATRCRPRPSSCRRTTCRSLGCTRGIDELAAHHRARCDEVIAACERPKSPSICCRCCSADRSTGTRWASPSARRSRTCTI